MSDWLYLSGPPPRRVALARRRVAGAVQTLLGHHGQTLVVGETPVAAAAAPPGRAAPTGHVVAPMSGRLTHAAVQAGSAVQAGDLLLVVEAMKMEYRVVAPRAGTVAEVAAQPPARVTAGDVLVRFA